MNKNISNGYRMLLSAVACVSFSVFTAQAAWYLTLGEDGNGTMTDGTLMLKVSGADLTSKTFNVDGCQTLPENLFALDLSGSVIRDGEEWYVAKISGGAFTNVLAKLTSVKLRGEKLHTIGSYAFGYKTDQVTYPSENLVSLDVELPALREIGIASFANLRWLESLRFHAPLLAKLPDQALSFMGCNALLDEKAASRWPVADIYLPNISNVSYAGMRYLDFAGTLRLPSFKESGNESFLDAGFITIEFGGGMDFNSFSLSRMNRASDLRGLPRNVIFGSKAPKFTKALTSCRTTYSFCGPPPTFVGTGFRNDQLCPKSEYLRFCADKSAPGWEFVAEAARLRPLSADELSDYREIYGDDSMPVGWVAYEDFGGTGAAGPFAVFVLGELAHMLPDLQVCSEPAGVGGVEPECGTYKVMNVSDRTMTVSAAEVSCVRGRYMPVKYVLENASFNGWGAPVTNMYTAGTDVEIGFTTDCMKRLTWLFECRSPGVEVEECVNGTVSVNPAPDEDTGYYEIGTEVVINARAADGYVFVRWEGNVPEEFRENPELSLVLNDGVCLKPVFSKGWVYDSVSGTVSDGTWTLAVEVNNIADKTLTVKGVSQSPSTKSPLDLAKGVHDGSVTWFFGEIGDGAFSSSIDLISEISLGGEKLSSIGEKAFSKGSEQKLNMSVLSLVAELPALQALGDKAFYGMRGLTKFDFRASELKTIGMSAFYNLGQSGYVVDGVLYAPKIKELREEQFGGSWIRFYHRFPLLSKLYNRSFSGSYAVQYAEVGTESGIDNWQGAVLGALDQMRNAVIGARNDKTAIDMSAEASLKVIHNRTLTCWFMGLPPILGMSSINYSKSGGYTNCCFAPCVGAPGWERLSMAAAARPLDDAAKAHYANKFPDAPPPIGWITYRDFGLDSDAKIGYLAKSGNPYMTTTDLIVKTVPEKLGVSLPCDPVVGHIRSLTYPRSLVASAPHGRFVAGNGSKWVFEGHVLEVADHDSLTGWSKIDEGPESIVKVDYAENGAKRITWNYRYIPGLMIKIR